MKENKGLHHITVLAGDPKLNAQFYIDGLGMRMVKKSINQDDPGTYHLFYGNEAAEPGSSLTFFPWPRAHKGVVGTGEAVNVAFNVPEGSQEFWRERLHFLGLSHSDFFYILGKQGIRFNDPDGLEIDLIFSGKPKNKISTYNSSVPASVAIQGFDSTRLKLSKADDTITILTNILGFKEIKSERNLTLLKTDAKIGNSVIIETAEIEHGRGGRGIIHHVAFRAENLDELNRIREAILAAGLQPTRVIDRHWFKSIYFKEPGGVLFEVATDCPGYTVDEKFEELGQKLILPPWLEPKRELIERSLPSLN